MSHSSQSPATVQTRARARGRRPPPLPSNAEDIQGNNSQMAPAVLPDASILLNYRRSPAAASLHVVPGDDIAKEVQRLKLRERFDRNSPVREAQRSQDQLAGKPVYADVEGPQSYAERYRKSPIRNLEKEQKFDDVVGSFLRREGSSRNLGRGTSPPAGGRHDFLLRRDAANLQSSQTFSLRQESDFTDAMQDTTRPPRASQLSALHRVSSATHLSTPHPRGYRAVLSHQTSATDLSEGGIYFERDAAHSSQGTTPASGADMLHFHAGANRTPSGHSIARRWVDADIERYSTPTPTVSATTGASTPSSMHHHDVRRSPAGHRRHNAETLRTNPIGEFLNESPSAPSLGWKTYKSLDYPAVGTPTSVAISSTPRTYSPQELQHLQTSPKREYSTIASRGRSACTADRLKEDAQKKREEEASRSPTRNRRRQSGDVSEATTSRGDQPAPVVRSTVASVKRLAAVLLSRFKKEETEGKPPKTRSSPVRAKDTSFPNAEVIGSLHRQKHVERISSNPHALPGFYPKGGPPRATPMGIKRAQTSPNMMVLQSEARAKHFERMESARQSPRGVDVEPAYQTPQPSEVTYSLDSLRGGETTASSTVGPMASSFARDTSKKPPIGFYLDAIHRNPAPRETVAERRRSPTRKNAWVSDF